MVVEKTDPQSKPKTTIAFKDKNNLSLGTVKFGSKLERTFEFTNTGSNEFVIENITGSCECTEIVDFTKRVKPGKTGFVKIVFDSNKASIQKAYNSGIEIFANTEKEPLTMFQFTADVEK